VLLDAHAAGIERFVIVLGYRSDAIQSWVRGRRFPGMEIEFVENSEYKNKANGISVLKARNTIAEPFLLLMSDHVFESQTAAILLRQRLEEKSAILAVDRKLDCIFDMDDATKVRCAGDYIIEIGKELIRYDAVDTGMFLCTPALFAALDEGTKDGDCSLSDGMRLLAGNRKLRAFDIGEATWQDVDTPEMLSYGSTMFVEPFPTNGISSEGARV
jgi:1L-myo-inositol 1-phosphate cytidylyltransferase